jgi:hypothetical protein
VRDYRDADRLQEVRSIGKPKSDGKAWARAICENVANGHRYPTQLSLDYALEALDVRREDWDEQRLEALPGKSASP